MVWPSVNDSKVVVINTRHRTSGSMSRLLVTSRLLTTVSRTLSTSPRGAINPMRCKRSATFSSAWRSQERCACTGVKSLADFESSCTEPSTRILLLPGMAYVVSPQARLRFEVQFLGQRVVQIFLFAVNEGRQPQAWLRVGAPAVEVEIPTGVSSSSVSAVETHNVEILIFHPNASEEPAFARFGFRSNVENQATHFAQEFPAHVIELIVLSVEAIRVDENHLQEAVRQVLHGEGEEVPDTRENLFALGVGIRQGNQVHTLGKIRTPQKVFVAGR